MQDSSRRRANLCRLQASAAGGPKSARHIEMLAPNLTQRRCLLEAACSPGEWKQTQRRPLPTPTQCTCTHSGRMSTTAPYRHHLRNALCSHRNPGCKDSEPSGSKTTTLTPALPRGRTRQFTTMHHRRRRKVSICEMNTWAKFARRRRRETTTARNYGANLDSNACDARIQEMQPPRCSSDNLGLANDGGTDRTIPQ